MQQTHWSMHLIKQCEDKIKQAMLRDEHSLVSYSEDFGHLNQSMPSAVCSIKSKDTLQKLLYFVQENHLNLTLRGGGLSQGGQCLTRNNDLLVELKSFNSTPQIIENAMWVDATSSWSALLDCSFKQQKIPYVLPYNCNLSIGGVLSAGGIGSSSFKHGSIISHVDALEVMRADGVIEEVGSESPLFQACLGGQGRFGVITRACIQLRHCLSYVRSFFLVYLEKDIWLQDLKELKTQADYIEAFCSPSIIGARLLDGKRSSFANWLYIIQVSVEYENQAPALNNLGSNLKPWKTAHIQDEPIYSYLHRHDSRFETMKLIGQWQLPHIWYECFLPSRVLSKNLEKLLSELPIFYANIVQIVPIANSYPCGFFMLPPVSDITALMILNPGLHQALVPPTLQTIRSLDEILLHEGGKRYLSGYLGENIREPYWEKHFGNLFQSWIDKKKILDPNGIFQSYLHRF